MSRVQAILQRRAVTAARNINGNTSSMITILLPRKPLILTPMRHHPMRAIQRSLRCHTTDATTRKNTSDNTSTSTNRPTVRRWQSESVPLQPSAGSGNEGKHPNNVDGALTANPRNVSGELQPHNTPGMMQYMKAYSDLGKLKLSSLVVATTAAGYIAAGPIPFEYHASVFAATILGTTFCSCCASGFNQIYELPRDRLMKRTQSRPLVTGILRPYPATMVTATWGVIGTATLYQYTDPITTALGLGNILLYAGIYTPLKPITIYNTWIGAVVGAIPPLMGYTAATNFLHARHVDALTDTWSSSSSLSSLSSSTALDIASAAATASSPDLISTVTTIPVISTELLSSYITDPIAISLVSTLYFWQLPHFMALSYMYRMDYKRGGFMMVPIASVGRGSTSDDMISDIGKDLGSTDNTIHTDSAGERTSKIIVRYAWYLSMVPIFSTIMDVTSSMYLLESILLNAYALRVAYKFRDQQTNQNARNIFLTSLWYLPCTLMLFLLHSKAWDDTVTADETNTNRNAVTQFLSEQIHSIRNKGRDLCIHEQAIAKSTGAVATKVTATVKANGTSDGNNTVDEEIDIRSEASCPVMIVRNTDPNIIKINHHTANTVAMAAAQQPSSPAEE